MAQVVKCGSCGTKNRVPVSTKGRPRCASCHNDLPWLVDAGSGDFDSAVATNIPVLVDLWAPWCGPCRSMAPAIDQAARDFAGRVKVVKVNVDEAPDVSARFAVQGVPTLLMMRDGQVVDRQIGALPADRLSSWTAQHIAPKS